MIENQKKEIIGRIEKISLPEFHLKNIDAKIDTGAYNGAIHVSGIKEIGTGDSLKLKFTLLDKDHPEYNGKVFEAESFQKKTVRNAIGGSEVRYYIPTKIILKNQEIDVKLGLSNRKNMKYPILIGRKIIKKHFVVDAAKKFTSAK
jgi:hypothetical protein